MTDRIDQAFQKPPAFMPYFPLGYPAIESSLDVIQALAENGADLVEVGLPFSDPLADGPVIQRATQVALKNGVTVEKGLALVAELRRRGVRTPLVLMPYYNPLLSYGLEAFARRAREAGVDALIVPDLPPEESGELDAALGENTPLIRMLAPTTAPERAKRICATARGFLYVVSVTGVTGARTRVSDGLKPMLKEIRGLLPPSGNGRMGGIPLCVGFGISTPAQAAEVGRIAEGVIVGSACVKTVGEAKDPAEAAKIFAQDFRQALDGCRQVQS